jgi:hypothetical protein
VAVKLHFIDPVARRQHRDSERPHWFDERKGTPRYLFRGVWSSALAVRLPRPYRDSYPKTSFNPISIASRSKWAENFANRTADCQRSFVPVLIVRVVDHCRPQKFHRTPGVHSAIQRFIMPARQKLEAWDQYAIDLSLNTLFAHQLFKPEKIPPRREMREPGSGRNDI